MADKAQGEAPVRVSVPVTVALEKGVTAKTGKSYPVFVLRTPSGNLQVSGIERANVLHTLISHPKAGAIAAALGKRVLTATEQIAPGREVLDTETI